MESLKVQAFHNALAWPRLDAALRSPSLEAALRR
jgi:hypothetical protein